MTLEKQIYVLITKDMLNANCNPTVHRIEPSCLPFQYCGSSEHISNTCPQMMVCLTCKTKNHSSHYIWSLWQNPAVGQALDHKCYYSDDPFLSHHIHNIT